MDYQKIDYNEEVAYPNAETVIRMRLLKYHHNIDNDIERVPRFYFLQ